MATIKSYTSLEQSKKLAKILPLESSDGYWDFQIDGYNLIADELGYYKNDSEIPCWSLAALLNILYSKSKNILSLSGGGYKEGKYISDWCLDYEFENGDYQKTFASNPIDACYELILKLHELKML